MQKNLQNLVLPLNIAHKTDLCNLLEVCPTHSARLGHICWQPHGAPASVPVAVVWGRPDGEHGLVEVPLVALHDQLVGPADHVDVVGRVELGHHVAAKQVACPPGAHPPALGICKGETEDVSRNKSATEPSGVSNGQCFRSERCAM